MCGCYVINCCDILYELHRFLFDLRCHFIRIQQCHVLHTRTQTFFCHFDCRGKAILSICGQIKFKPPPQSSVKRYILVVLLSLYISSLIQLLLVALYCLSHFIMFSIWDELVTIFNESGNELLLNTLDQLFWFYQQHQQQYCIRIGNNNNSTHWIVDNFGWLILNVLPISTI